MLLFLLFYIFFEKGKNEKRIFCANNDNSFHSFAVPFFSAFFLPLVFSILMRSFQQLGQKRERKEKFNNIEVPKLVNNIQKIDF